MNDTDMLTHSMAVNDQDDTFFFGWLWENIWKERAVKHCNIVKQSQSV